MNLKEKSNRNRNNQRPSSDPKRGGKESAMRELSPRLAGRVNKLVNRVVQARLEGDGRPFIIGHLITQRCMCNCRSCLWKHNDYEDVPFEDIRKFYAQAA